MDDPEIPGNVGLLDVRKALIWVQKNIMAFGGDPQRVTLAGQDSGGTMALLLKASEIGENLFSKLILRSQAFFVCPFMRKIRLTDSVQPFSTTYAAVRIIIRFLF